MDTTRQQKINRLIQKEMGDIFLLQTKQMSGVLVSVSGVKVSPDLGIAKIYLSIFPSDRAKELLKNIQANTKAIRFDLGQRLGKNLRIIPELTFYQDDSLDYIENIDRLLNVDKKNDKQEE